jgi:hypothetical protein
MTAHDLIASIFARAQGGMPGNERRITPAQLKYLRDLIGQDEEGGALASVGPGVSVWMPAGKSKFVLCEDLRGDRHVLRRMAKMVPTGMGTLF